MRNLEEIIIELKSVTEWSRPNVAYEKTMELISELELYIAPKETEKQPIKQSIKVEVEKTEIPNDINISIDDIKSEVVEPVKKVIGKRPKATN